MRERDRQRQRQREIERESERERAFVGFVAAPMSPYADTGAFCQVKD